MITTTSGKGLVFPKGGWEDDESVDAAAQRETVEEAGVRGVLEEPLLGVFSFASGKHTQEGSSTPGRCKAYIYVMHVAEELPCWPESNDRQRIWCSIAEASQRCKHQWMREALQAWVRRRGWAVEGGEAEVAGGGTGNGGTAQGQALGNGQAQQQAQQQVQQHGHQPQSEADGEMPRYGSSSAHFGAAAGYNFKAVGGPCVSSNST